MTTIKNNLPTISTIYDVQPDGKWATTIVVSGLKDEEMAIRVQEHIILSFCGGEITKETKQ